MKTKLQLHNETNNLDDTAYKANAFALTFAFATTHRQKQQKQKRVQATAPVHRRPDRKQGGQFSVYSTTTTLRTVRRAADNSGLAKVAVQFFV
ncbi:MAG: hypothetical protein CVT98_00850 [Bacteroidetes bacterium HGW-Bacteroidetes-15]|nr:MAG: hypothetical protein CVT98_00850 [Bacteroidetes bacterium HGW-Bacteroidetes-15]